MKKGSYDLAHYSIYFIIAIIILAAQITSIKYSTSRNVLDIYDQKQKSQEYLFSRALLNCMSFKDDTGLVSEGKISLKQFTDERLRSCTSEPVALFLLEENKQGVRVIATDDSLKFYSSLKLLDHETVLIDGNLAVLTVGVHNA